MFERDQGVCAHCGADTKLQEKEILKVTKAFASKTFKVPPNKVRFVRLFSLWMDREDSKKLNLVLELPNGNA